MPFQPINFASIAPLGNPAMRDLIPTIMQGLQAGAMPAQLRRAAQAQQMANAMQQLKLQQEPQDFAANMKSKDLANAFQAMLNKEQPDKFSSAMASAAANQGLAQASTNRANTMLPYDVAAARMNTDPAAKVDYMNALLQKLGQPSGGSTINPDDANKLLNSGIATTAPSDVTAAWKNAMTRKLLGLPQQTPEEKNAAALDLFRQKQGIKAQLPTPAFATQNQTSMQAIDNLMPAIDELKSMDIPGQGLSKLYYRTNQAAYKAKLGEIKDTLIKGLGLKPTDTLVNMMDDIAGLQLGENQTAYRQKLDRLKSELGRRRATFASNLQGIPMTSAYGSSNTAPHDPLGWR